MPSMTLYDMKNRLSRALSETDLLEVLEITNEDLVDRFEDFILEKWDYLEEELEDEEGE